MGEKANSSHSILLAADQPNLWSAEARGAFTVRMLIAGLFIVAAVNFLWPTYRAFLNIEIIYNEGWNAYFDSAAMGRMPLYPRPDTLMINNYPPVSFFIVGGLGSVLHNTLLAGRLLSLASVLTVGITIVLAVERLGGSRLGGFIGGGFFVAAMSNYFNGYVGMNDPQMLAHAFMAAGFYLFLRAMKYGRGYFFAFLVMVFAGFIKHNIITLPLSAMIWLAFHNRRLAVQCAIVSAVAAAIGFAICIWAFGHNFLADMTSSRRMIWYGIPNDIRGLYRVAAPVLAWLYMARRRRFDAASQMSALLIVVAMVVYFIQRRGSGVANNAEFDLVIAASIAGGLAFSWASAAPAMGTFGAQTRQSVFLAALILMLIPWQHRESFRLLFDPSFHQEIRVREAAFADAVAKVRSTPGDVKSSPLVCYEAGKYHFLDGFNTDERIAAGVFPRDIVDRRIRAGTLATVQYSPAYSWFHPMPR